ncbi:MAG: ABC transporter ATP-binding protein [Acidimicrobiales bacterium]
MSRPATSGRPAPEPAATDPGDRRGAAVRLTGVVHLYRQSGTDVVALRGVDLDVGAGEMVALLGPSGMGKTTVLRLMAGVLTPSAGVVEVGGRDLGRLGPSERRALRAGAIGYVVQGTSPNFLPFATVVENLWFAQHGARARGHAPPWEPAELLELLGLAELAGARLATLPRGRQQQVAVAAGLAPGPQLVVADEPTSQLAPDDARAVIDLFRRVNAERGTTVVIVTHDRSVAASFPRTVTIRDGRVGSEADHGEEYAVVDGTGSVQLPPDVLAVLPPNTRVRVLRRPDGVELRRPEDRR